MKILSECNLAQVVIELLNGKTFMFPTETSYGLGCDATNQSAADKIFAVKGRSDDKPLLCVVPNVAMAKQYLVWNDALENLATKYWPGALTIVAEYKGGGLAKGVVGKDNTVAIRVTSNELLKSITEKMGKPLVATSANVAGEPSLYDSADIERIFKNRTEQPDFVLSYGKLPENPASTLVSVVGGTVQILRQGAVVI